MQIKTYVINLPESTDRRDYILKETAKYPFMDVSLIEAVNGKKLTKEESERLFDREKFARHHSRYPAPGEIGCTLSHRKCYKTFLSTTDEVALILEDDVSFIRQEDTASVIEAGVKLLEKGQTDIVLFVPKVCYYSKPNAILPAYTAYPIYNAFETCAYLINRRGAECLLRTDRAFTVADDFWRMLKQGIRIDCIRPSIAVGLSTIQQADTLIEGRVYDLVEIPYFIHFKKTLKNHIRNIYIRLAIRMGWLVDKAFFNDPYK